jgi:hypothetical protein
VRRPRRPRFSLPTQTRVSTILRRQGLGEIDGPLGDALAQRLAAQELRGRGTSDRPTSPTSCGSVVPGLRGYALERAQAGKSSTGPSPRPPDHAVGLDVHGALLRIQPYGRRRHSVTLALLAASGVGIALEWIFRSRPWIPAAAALAAASLALFAAVLHWGDIRRFHAEKESMAAAIQYLQGSIQPGSVVLANQQTTRICAFTGLGPHDKTPTQLGSGETAPST